MENGVDILDDIEANDITAGHFKIHILPADGYALRQENVIDIEINAKGLPWLLDEKCNHKARTTHKASSKLIGRLIKNHSGLAMFLIKLFGFVPSLIGRHKQRKQMKTALSDELSKLKARFGVDYVVLKNKEISEYKKLWVKSFLPVGADEKLRKKAHDLCVENKRCNTFLWHMFSFQIIESEENPTEKFNSIPKESFTLLFDTGLKNIAIKMTNAEKIRECDIAVFCKNIAGWSDFVVTGNDFLWTYSRTHEDGWCGPYFYKKET